jgi:Tfp pilus assembly pilus retraction ATPase PilT
MQTLEMALRDLYLKKKITLEDALARSSRPEEFKRGLQNS